MGRLKDDMWFKDTEITDLHAELLIKCMNHDFHWLDDLIGRAFEGRWFAEMIRPFYKFFVRAAKWKARSAGIHSKFDTTRLK